MSDPSPLSDREPELLEREVALSQSLIWSRQREFYQQRGLRAWTEDRIPNFVTSNPFIADIYAHMVAAFLADCLGGASHAPPSAENPVRILELGAGTGKFACLFLRRVTALLAANNIAPEMVHYCMSDCSPGLIESWKQNRYLAEFVARGMLEFDLFEAGRQLSPGFLGAAKSQSAPLVVVANYVFDSLPNDAFVARDGEISEYVLTTRAPAAPATRSGDSELADSHPLARLLFTYSSIKISHDRFRDPLWGRILQQYRAVSGATVLFPSAALRLLQQISQFAQGPQLFLLADKGYVHPEDLPQGPPTLEFHSDNCFSQMVNFDALAKYFQATDGLALVPQKHSAILSLCAFLRGVDSDRLPATRAAYRESQEAFGPDDLFALLAWLNAHMEEISVSQALAVLRLTHWDPIALLRLFPVLARQLRGITSERLDMRNAVLKVWANHFPITPDEDLLAFDCGAILLELGFPDDALPMFQASQQILGPSAATSYNLALCCQGLRRNPEALIYAKDACDLDPASQPARLLLQKLSSAS